MKNIVKDMASLYDDEEEYINWFYKDKKQVEQAYSVAMEKKIVDEIIKLTEVVPVSITYAELVKKSN